MIRTLWQTPLPIIASVATMLYGLHWAGSAVNDRIDHGLVIEVTEPISRGEPSFNPDFLDSDRASESVPPRRLNCPQLVSQAPTRLSEAIETMKCLNRAERFSQTLALRTQWAAPAKKSIPFWLAVGRAQRALNRPAEAEAAYRRVLNINPQSFAATLHLGTLMLQLGHTAKAVRQFELAVTRGGGERRARAHILLGLALRQQKRINEAEKSFLEAIKLSPARIRPRLHLARLYGESWGRHDEARAMLDEATTLGPHEVAVHLAWSEYYTRIQDPKAARLATQRAVDLQPENERARYALAVQQFAAGRLDEARTHLKWLKAHGRHHRPQADFQLGRIASAENRPKDAVVHYQAAFDRSEGTYLEALNNLALAAKAMGDLERATAALNTALQHDPEYTTARFNLGLIRLQHNELDPAISHFQKMIEQDRRSFDAWYHLGLASGRKEDFSRAIEAYRHALEVQPAHIKSRLNLGVALRKSGQLQSAIDQYETLLRLQPQYAPAWFNLGLAYKEARRFDKAEHAYLRAIQAEPGSVRYPQALGRFYLSVDRSKDAVRLLEEAVALHPSEAKLRFELGSALWNMNQTKPALARLQQTVTLAPQLLEAWLLKARIETKTQDDHAAEATLRAATRAHPKSAKVFRHWGAVLVRLAAFHRAIEAYRTGLKLSPDHPTTLERLGKLQIEHGSVSKGLRRWLRLAKIRPQDHQHAYRLGKALYKAGRYDAAVGHLSRSTSKLTDRPWVDIWLGRAHEKLGNLQKARVSYRNALDKDPRFVQAYVSLGDLAKRRRRSEEAETLYTQALRLNPDHGPAKKRLRRLGLRADSPPAKRTSP